MGLGRGEGRILVWLDPIEDADARPPGESERGLPCRRHPFAWLADMPELHRFAVEALDGEFAELARGDIDRMSNAEFELALEWRSAVARRTRRELMAKRPPPRAKKRP